MECVIYTNTENMSKSLSKGIIRIPKNLTDRFNIKKLKLGDKILLFNYEDKRIYGFLNVIEKYREEKNPKSGPFNGFGKVKNHYYYLSIRVDASNFKKIGMDVNGIPELDINSFFILNSKVKNKIDEIINLLNTKPIPLIIEFRFINNKLMVSVLNIEDGIIIKENNINVDNSLIDLIKDRTSYLQKSINIMNYDEFLSTSTDMGGLIYEIIFQKLDLDVLFQSGGYSVSIIPDDTAVNIPMEFAYCCDSFLFEKNNITYMRKNKPVINREIFVKRVLIIADPGKKFKYSYEEGKKIFEYFYSNGVNCDFISRPISDLTLMSILKDYQLVHITGHGEVKRVNNVDLVSFDTGESLFQIRKLNYLKKLPNLFFFSMCSNSVKWGLELLKAKDVGNIILSRWNFPDTNDFDFFLNFYDLLLKGLEIGKVFNTQKLRYLKRTTSKNIMPFLFSHLGDTNIRYVF